MFLVAPAAEVRSLVMSSDDGPNRDGGDHEGTLLLSASK